ncbi:hypothetical protein RvY_18969 [Ramazzottius varieornatus]|uniref:Uncharacterized protein n=1 Tax=Ramazzottius varieornatus TaxID=947166 RepID=A0A1D1W7Q2_RAMVA|nr:hypothetical protein RvY_18969 [Ramazzottius varieornatus]
MTLRGKAMQVQLHRDIEEMIPARLMAKWDITLHCRLSAHSSSPKSWLNRMLGPGQLSPAVAQRTDAPCNIASDHAMDDSQILDGMDSKVQHQQELLQMLIDNMGLFTTPSHSPTKQLAIGGAAIRRKSYARHVMLALDETSDDNPSDMTPTKSASHLSM